MRLIDICISAITLLLLTCCSSNKKDHMTVTVSLPPEAWIVSQIAGDRMNVNTLLPNGANPETYDPTVGDIRRLSSSDLFLISGGLEFEKKIASQLPDDIITTNLSEGITLLYDTHGHNHKSDHYDNDPDHHGEENQYDPHTWSSVRNARIITTNILNALINADPDGKDYYNRRAENLLERLDSLDSAYSSRLTPLNGRSFLIWHPSLSYLARDYGLIQIPIGMENKEQSVRSLKSVIDSAKVSRPIVLFLQPEYDTPASAAIARDLGVELFTINPLNSDWWSETEATIGALTK